MSDVPKKVDDETIYRLRDMTSYREDGEMVTVKAGTLFEMCVELELWRYDADQAAQKQRK